MPTSRLPATTPVDIEGLIHEARGQKVIFDRDLAGLYGVPTRVLNQAVKRNPERFPPEFMFRIQQNELPRSRSQTVILKRGQNIKYLPFAFTEHGAIMAANVLRSPQAIRMSVAVVKTFVRLRRMALSITELAKKVEALERSTVANSDDIRALIAAVRQLMAPPDKPRREIGFHVRDGGGQKT
jgi:hypothetical protein